MQSSLILPVILNFDHHLEFEASFFQHSIIRPTTLVLHESLQFFLGVERSIFESYSFPRNLIYDILINSCFSVWIAWILNSIHFILEKCFAETHSRKGFKSIKVIHGRVFYHFLETCIWENRKHTMFPYKCST